MPRPRFAPPPPKQKPKLPSLVGAEVSAALDLHSPQTKRLHGTLRTITTMALDGCRRRKAHALVVTQDLQTSLRLAKQHAFIATRLVAGCQMPAQDILHDRLQPDAVAGAELYQQQEVAA